MRGAGWVNIKFSEIWKWAICDFLVLKYTDTSFDFVRRQTAINLYHAKVSFYTPWKYQQTIGF